MLSSACIHVCAQVEETDNPEPSSPRLVLAFFTHEIVMALSFAESRRLASRPRFGVSRWCSLSGGTPEPLIGVSGQLA